MSGVKSKLVRFLDFLDFFWISWSVLDFQKVKLNSAFAKSDHLWDQKNGTSSGTSAPALFCSGGFILPLEASKECGLSTDQRLDCSIIGINRRSSSLQLVATWRHHDAWQLVCTSSKFKARKLPLMSCFDFHTLVSLNRALGTHFVPRSIWCFPLCSGQCKINYSGSDHDDEGEWKH